MHYASHSMSSTLGYESSKENTDPNHEEYGSAIANYKDKVKTGQQGFQQQHRVALSDVTSQISNKPNMTISNSSLPNTFDPSKKLGNMLRNETYFIEGESEVAEESENKLIGTRQYLEDPGSHMDHSKNNSPMEDGEEEDEYDDLDSEDELREPLSPVYTSKSQILLDEAFQEYHRDVPDPLDDDTYDVVMVVELSNEIFEYMRKLEIKYRPNPYYMNSQPELKWSYRSTLIDWIVQVHSRFQLLPETLYLTINIIDRFLSRKTVTLNRFQLVGAAALFIAAKYEEINCPTLKDIVYMLDNAYNREDIIKAEKFMIDTLDFEIGWPGPMSFLRRISKADEYEYDIRTLAKYLLETTIMDPKLAAAPPSWLASGAYFLSRVILGSNNWSTKHVYYSGYTQEQIFSLATVILENCRYAERRHQAIWKKYSERRQHRSAQVVAKWIALAEKKVDQSTALPA